VSAAPNRLVEQFPWPEDLRALGPQLDFLWNFELRAAPERLWPHIIETSRFNRAVGLSAMNFREVNGILHGVSRNAGVRQEWVEMPWEWVAPRTLSSVRRYGRGLAHVARAIYTLSSTPAGSALQVYFGWVPRNAYGAVALKLGMRWLQQAYRQVLAELEAEVARGSPASGVLRRRPARLPQSARARLADLCGQLRSNGVSARAIDHLSAHIEHADEIELYRLRPVALARTWRIGETELVSAFMHATRVGMLTVSWDVICPHCRGVRYEAATLGDVPSSQQCEVCDIDFKTEVDAALEITFHVHPSIRDVPRVFYCSAEPATKRHIHVQQVLAGSQHREIETALAPGRYRVRVRGRQEFRFLDVSDASPVQRVRCRASDSNDPLEVGVEPVIELVNDTEQPCAFVIEEAAWGDEALRPSRLFGLQEFRDLFSREYLASDVHIEVGEQTILFTDIVGSTTFYGSRGDAEAFSEVKRHFTEVYQVVAAHDGAVVKTIGDAVMAGFANPLDAVLAAGAIMYRFPPMRDNAVNPVRLRASINTGPCIAVNLNRGIDYFGGTVNIAAKLQSLAGAGQVAFSRSVYTAPGVKQALQERRVQLKMRTIEHPALPEPLVVYRWDVDAPVTTEASSLANGAAGASAHSTGPDGTSPDGTSPEGTSPEGAL
jgi:class 3 adenylate cyclase